MSHHSSTVAAEAKVPGPGRKRPQPKKVAMSQASLPALGRATATSLLSGLVLLAGIIAVLACPRTLLISPRIGLETHFFRIRNGSGNDVATAGPLAQIYETATLAAERKLGIIAKHQLFAGGAAQAEHSLTGHGIIE